MKPDTAAQLQFFSVIRTISPRHALRPSSVDVAMSEGRSHTSPPFQSLCRCLSCSDDVHIDVATVLTIYQSTVAKSASHERLTKSVPHRIGNLRHDHGSRARCLHGRSYAVFTRLSPPLLLTTFSSLYTAPRHLTASVTATSVHTSGTPTLYYPGDTPAAS